MRDRITDAMKQALKAKDQAALGTMRLIMAALKDRDIAARGNGNQDGISDDDILSMLQTMIKQRNESAKMSPSKNDFRTRSHRGRRGTSTTIAAMTIAVLVDAISRDRLRCRCSYASRRVCWSMPALTLRRGQTTA